METSAHGDSGRIAEGATLLTGRDSDFDLAAFVEEHYDRLIRLAGLICNDASDAQEAVQNGLERAWRKRSQLLRPGSARYWIDRIVVREAIRRSARRRVWLRHIEPTPSEAEPADQGPSPSSTVALRLAYASLPSRDRAVITLHHYAGYSIAETATLLQLPKETVRSRLRAARSRMRERLEVPER